MSGKGVSKMNERKEWREACKYANLLNDFRQLEEEDEGLSWKKHSK